MSQHDAIDLDHLNFSEYILNYYIPKFKSFYRNYLTAQPGACVAQSSSAKFRQRGYAIVVIGLV
jgi:hypothetical protein